MHRNFFKLKDFKLLCLIGVIIALVPLKICFGAEQRMEVSPPSANTNWEAVGRFAADTSMTLIKQKVANLQTKNLIAMTNAGYAEVNGSLTQPVLDGVTAVTGVSRGRNTLVEIHSAPWTPLYVALYDKVSGFCAYLEIESSQVSEITKGPIMESPRLFKVKALERIDAAYLYQHATEFNPKFEGKVFGGNEFRIISIANAIAAGAPADAVRAFEFHDHYCPGVTSGILMARYLKKNFPPGKSGYFVHAVSPWCKEDALLVLLNATPGKRSYAVSYPSDADIKARLPQAKNAASIIYRQNDQTKDWEAIILSFEWGEPSCPKSGNGLIDKLCADLWYLDQMGQPEKYVKVLKTVALPAGVSPKDWARPGVDLLKKLGLVRTES